MSNNTTQASNGLPIKLLMNQLHLGFNVFAIIFGGFGNGLVLTVVFNKKQKNVHDVFIANLAIADILFILFSTPGEVLQVIQKPPNSYAYCLIVRPLVTMFFCLGLFTITLMAIYRCYVMVNPYKPKMKFAFVYLCVFAVWLMSFITCLPAMIVATVVPPGRCTGNWKSKVYKDAYIVFLLLVKCVIPLFMIAVSYVQVGVFLLYHKSAVTNNASAKRDRVENLKIIRTIALIVLLFALCTMPYQVGWAMLQFGGPAVNKEARMMLLITPLVQILHTCVNPIIYAISRKYFRQEYKKYVRKICCICFCDKNNVRVDPTVCDDFTQQPRRSTHELNEVDSMDQSDRSYQKIESDENFHRRKLSLLTRSEVITPGGQDNLTRL